MQNIKNILITRPAEDCEILAHKLQELGYNVFKNPLLKVEFTTENINFLKQQITENKTAVFLATSANSVRALDKIISIKELEILAIGSASKTEALNLGFGNVKSITDDYRIKISDTENMQKYIELNYKKTQKIIHISGVNVAGNLTEKLKEVGYDAEKIILYNTISAESFDKEIFTKLKNNKIDLVCLYSQKTAETFDEIWQKTMETPSKNLKLLTLSQKITNLLASKGWKNIITANKPEDAAVILKIKEQN